MSTAVAADPLTNTPLPADRPGAEVARRIGAGWAVFLVGAVGLFLELLLIRWVTTEIRIFAYLQNTVLVVCFLGLGMGCWDSRRRFALRDVLLPLAILTGLLAIPPVRYLLGTSITDLLSGASGLVIWGGGELGGAAAAAGGVIGLALTFALMFLLWAAFVPVGRLLGGLMADHPHPLRAYSVNVAGSLVGIWLFVGCSAAGLPPVTWFALFAAGCVPLIGTGGRSKWVDKGLVAAIVGGGALAGVEPGWEEVRWSPYQKLALFRFDEGKQGGLWAYVGGERHPPNFGFGTHMISVNNIGYQATVDLRAENVAANPQWYPAGQRGYSQYDLPPKFHPNPKATLVVGAGSGNDVAGMLRNGAGEVVAVEIDPEIIRYGRRVHPENPYADPRVTVVTDDARSYFATADRTFDVIAFGLLDSHTTTSMTNARLDHYVYTRESLTRARQLLNPGGVMVLSFEAQKPFILDRMARCLEEVFGHPPVVFRVPPNGFGWGGVVFVTGDLDAVRGRLAADPTLNGLVTDWQKDTPARSGEPAEVTSDDWPYIYLEGRGIPPLYLMLAAGLLALFAFGLRSLNAGHIVRGWDRSNTHFALLGAGFMLLEVQNISKAAVVLGNTWVVNAVIISGVLLMVLAANALTPRLKRLPDGPVYAALLASCVGLYFLDLSRFGFLPYWQKAAVVGLLTSLPMLFSGLVFARSFAAAPRKDAALGANLFGSLAGALVQSVTFVTGIKALLLVVAAFYLGAALTRPKAKK